MLEYFFVSLIVYIVTVTFSIWPSCCKKKPKKGKKRPQKSKSRSRGTHPKRSDRNPHAIQTNLIVQQQQLQPPQALSKESNEPIDTPDKITPQNDVDKNNKDDDEDPAELCRCRDYTPQIFNDLNHLFDLLV